MSFFEPSMGYLRIADVLDVALVATLIYFGLIWFRQRAWRPAAIAVLLLSFMYAAARWLEMYLTMMLFPAGLLVVALALVIVFQEDIRRAFERIASWRAFGGQDRARPVSAALDTLAESVSTLAERNFGALLVLEGREPLERHLGGGISVDGRISLPLLCSIFDPRSPGHDGAVLLDGERIVKFGVHMPLSKDLDRVGAAGTRHAAALGLAERCDALVIVVSEERGTISLAEHGELQPIDAAQLRPRLEAFYQSRFEPQAERKWTRALSENLGWKLLALFCAAMLWLLLANRMETVQRTFIVPVEYRNLSEDLVLDQPRPTRAEITLSGPQRAFDLLDADSLVISVDLSGARAGAPFRFKTAASLNLPPELRLTQIVPREILIQVRPKSEPANSRAGT